MITMMVHSTCLGSGTGISIYMINGAGMTLMISTGGCDDLG